MPPSASTPIASSHSSSRAWPCASPPPTASAPLTTHQTRIRSKLRRSVPAGSTATMKMVRPICISAYAPPTHRPHGPKARGSATDIARLTSISATSSSRTCSRSGSSQFVTHVV